MLRLAHLKNNPRLKTYDNNVLFSLFLVRLISSSLPDSDWKQKAVTGEVNTFFLSEYNTFSSDVVASEASGLECDVLEAGKKKWRSKEG